MEGLTSGGGVKQINGYNDRVNWGIKAQREEEKRRRETGDT